MIPIDKRLASAADMTRFLILELQRVDRVLVFIAVDGMLRLKFADDPAVAQFCMKEDFLLFRSGRITGSTGQYALARSRLSVARIRELTAGIDVEVTEHVEREGK